MKLEGEKAPYEYVFDEQYTSKSKIQPIAEYIASNGVPLSLTWLAAKALKPEDVQKAIGYDLKATVVLCAQRYLKFIATQPDSKQTGDFLSHEGAGTITTIERFYLSCGRFHSFDPYKKNFL